MIRATLANTRTQRRQLLTGSWPAELTTNFKNKSVFNCRQELSRVISVMYARLDLYT